MATTDTGTGPGGPGSGNRGDGGGRSDGGGRFWLRACSLTVADASGQGLELADLRITFQTRKGDTETPNSAKIKIYNLSEATVSRMRKEFSRVVLKAGYKDNVGVIFDGNIRQTRVGRENGTDSWIELTAADGDKAYNFAIVNTTLAAGSTPADRVGVCGNAFAAKGAGVGHKPDLPGNALARGRVMYGMARKFMREESANVGCSWSIQDGKMIMVENRGVLPGEAVVLTHETGLIDSPEETNEGVKLRCLLNPLLRVGGRIKLDNKSVMRAGTALSASAPRAPKQDNDGLYRILTIEYTGDTRGTAWYADLVCLALDGGSPTDVLAC